MRHTRIYETTFNTSGETINLSPENAHHLATVLRLKANEMITLFNGDGFDYKAEIIDAHKRHMKVNILSQEKNNTESPIKIHLMQSLCRGEKMDFVIQKAVELGVTEITPVISERTQGLRDKSKLAKKEAHFRKVMISACEQSGRATLPVLHAIKDFSAVVSANHKGKKWILHPQASSNAPLDEKNNNQYFNLLIGPEGGFSDSEVESALATNFNCKVLGPRVLRSETAALAAISALQANFGDYGAIEG